MNDKQAAPRVSLAWLFWIFLEAGALSFGGGVVAYLREFLVRGQNWLDDDQFLEALEISETLPGLNSVNMSVIVGDRLRGVAGATVAVLGMVLPGTVVVMALGVYYVEHRENPAINKFLLGIAAAAVGLLLAVTIQLGHKQLEHVRDLLLVVATCLAVSWFHFSLVTVLLVIGTIAILLNHPKRNKTDATAKLRRRSIPHHLRHG